MQCPVRTWAGGPAEISLGECNFVAERGADVQCQLFATVGFMQDWEVALLDTAGRVARHQQDRQARRPNADSQLRTKTWPEVTKWLRLMINRAWFKAAATAVFSAEAEHERLWRADAIRWSEETARYPTSRKMGRSRPTTRC